MNALNLSERLMSNALLLVFIRAQNRQFNSAALFLWLVNVTVILPIEPDSMKVD